jgi:hypothetical protein
LEPFIIAHVLRAEMAARQTNNFVSSCRMLRHNDARYSTKEDRLPETVATSIFEDM